VVLARGVPTAHPGLVLHVDVISGVTRGVLEARLSHTGAGRMISALYGAWSFGPYGLKDKFFEDGALVEDFQSFIALVIVRADGTLGEVQAALLRLGDALPPEQRIHWRREVNSVAADLGAPWDHWFEPARLALVELGFEATRLADAEDRESALFVLSALRRHALHRYERGEREIEDEILAGAKRKSLLLRLSTSLEDTLTEIEIVERKLRRPRAI
jgi:hypothetical protein